MYNTSRINQDDNYEPFHPDSTKTFYLFKKKVKKSTDKVFLFWVTENHIAKTAFSTIAGQR